MTTHFMMMTVVLNVAVSAYSAADLTASRLAPVNLRGYGKVSGEQETFQDAAGKPASILTIRCEDEGKAKLTLAKYLSDLSTLPGVSTSCVFAAGMNVPIRVIDGQGVIGAARGGKRVLILTAADPEQFVIAYQERLAKRMRQPEWAPEVDVPMWLNRWDQYGFRFYYSPFALPQPGFPFGLPEGTLPETYDFTKEFDYARDTGSGLVLWTRLSNVGMAEGITDEQAWNWIEKWALDRKVPVGINLSAQNFSQSHWIVNRYRDQMSLPMPHYLGDSMSVGGERGTEGKGGELAWGATPARDAVFGALQQVVRHHVNQPNLVSWLEPHGEFYQGGDAFENYGPAADRIYRDFLKARYGSLRKLGQAWYGESSHYGSWEEVTAPEVAHFAGWGQEALDVSGKWKVGYPDKQQAAPDAWFGAAFDDASWLDVTAPGDDRNFFLPKKPAVYRRTLNIPQEWLAKHPRVWLYVWDLNTVWEQPVSVHINGQFVAKDPCRHPNPHWMQVEVTPALRPGDNQITLGIPGGYIAYRVYLSPTEPKQYPNLGVGLNTQWADFVDWREWSRMASARRGVEMIREVDPNRTIDFMAPGASSNGLKALAEDFGGHFKDTGFMSGLWADLLPSLMRGSGRPFSLEPGGPAQSLNEFKQCLGLWHIEGLQAVDYFIHLNWVMLFPEIRKHFEATQPLFHLFGKYHAPRADLAFLWDMREGALTGFPWGSDPNINIGSGWSSRQVPESLWEYYPRDGVTEGDFPRGNAAKYKVIIDTSTSILEEQEIADIEHYVRNGGIFVTIGQTGRHTSARPDSWPISKLTGYDVLTYDKFDTNGWNRSTFAPDDPAPGTPRQPLGVHAADGQEVYRPDQAWMPNVYYSGLRMKKRTEDAQDLLLWADGTVAAGMRKLGKGYIVHFGYKVNGRGVSIDPGVLMPLLDWAGVKRRSAKLEIAANPDGSPVRHYLFNEFVSNNGLYNIWIIWNSSRDKKLNLSLVFNDKRPVPAVDLLTGNATPVKDGRLNDLVLEPLETRVYLTPRLDLARAPLEWFELQKDWWKGTTPVKKGFPKPSENFTRILNEGWSWRAVAEGDKSEAWVAPGFDDGTWERMPLGIWNTPDGKHKTSHAAMRRTFVVPPEWKHGRVELWVESTEYPTFTQEGRIWLDGKEVHGWGNSGIRTAADGALKAGTEHTIAIEMRGKGVFAGLAGDCWLTWVPDPDASIDLAGTWSLTKDYFHEIGQATLPGRYVAQTLRRQIVVPESHKDKNVVLSVRAERAFSVLVNKTLVRFNGNIVGGNNLNITPWIRFGEPNDIELVSIYDQGEVTRVALDIYKKDVYP